jgi:hypothetical protein
VPQAVRAEHGDGRDEGQAAHERAEGGAVAAVPREMEGTGACHGGLLAGASPICKDDPPAAPGRN